MIFDRNYDIGRLEAFLRENDKAFTHPLSEVLSGQNATLHSYAEKLALRGTIACETDETGAIKGMVIGYTHDLPADGGSYITQAVTGLAFRRQGVCRRLLREYLDYCREAGVRYVWLTTGQENCAAQKTYESVGFVQVDYPEQMRVKYVYHFEMESLKHET